MSKHVLIRTNGRLSAEIVGPRKSESPQKPVPVPSAHDLDIGDLEAATPKPGGGVSGSILDVVIVAAHLLWLIESIPVWPVRSATGGHGAEPPSFSTTPVISFEQRIRRDAECWDTVPRRRTSMQTQATSDSFYNDYFVLHSQPHYKLSKGEMANALPTQPRKPQSGEKTSTKLSPQKTTSLH